MATRVVSKTINLDAPIEEVSKYITDITEGGINIHSKTQGEAGSIQLDGTGLEIFDKNNVSTAKYGTDTRIGQESANHLEIDSEGTYIIDNNNKILAKYGSETIIGSEDNYHIEITSGTSEDPNDPAMLKFITGGENPVVVAYMSNEELNIPRVVVLDSMKVGKWKWDGKSNSNHLTLRWNG